MEEEPLQAEIGRREEQTTTTQTTTTTEALRLSSIEGQVTFFISISVSTSRSAIFGAFKRRHATYERNRQTPAPMRKPGVSGNASTGIGEPSRSRRENSHCCDQKKNFRPP